MAEELLTKTHCRKAVCRCVIASRIRPQCKGSDDSSVIAKKQFCQLECRFQKNPELKQELFEYMREDRRLGYMRLAKQLKAGQLCYWLPHGVKKIPNSLECVGKTSNGESLNSIQVIGYKLQYGAQLQIMRWRKHKYAVATDKTKCSIEYDWIRNNGICVGCSGANLKKNA